MERIPIPKGVNVETENLLNQIMDEASGKYIVLDSAPTTVNQLLKEGQKGIFSGATKPF